MMPEQYPELLADQAKTVLSSQALPRAPLNMDWFQEFHCYHAGTPGRSVFRMSYLIMVEAENYQEIGTPRNSSVQAPSYPVQKAREKTQSLESDLFMIKLGVGGEQSILTFQSAKAASRG